MGFFFLFVDFLFFLLTLEHFFCIQGNQEGEEKQDDLEMEEMFSPILGAAAPGQSFSSIHQAIGLVEEEEDEEEEGDRSTLVEQGRNYQVEEEGEELYPPQPMRTKKRRYEISHLHLYQTEDF